MTPVPWPAFPPPPPPPPPPERLRLPPVSTFTDGLPGQGFGTDSVPTAKTLDLTNVQEDGERERSEKP
jgi:hypothetical protein